MRWYYNVSLICELGMILELIAAVLIVNVVASRMHISAKFFVVNILVCDALHVIELIIGSKGFFDAC